MEEVLQKIFLNNQALKSNMILLGAIL